MSSFSQILLQIVFGAKYSTSFLNHNNQDMLFNYMAGLCKNKSIIPHIIGGHNNHVHILIKLHPVISVAEFVKAVKTSSNSFMKERWEIFPNFESWQVGYGAFSYSYDAKANLVNYIRNQFEHHEKKTFRREYIELLDEFEIEYDERYLDI